MACNRCDKTVCDGCCPTGAQEPNPRCIGCGCCPLCLAEPLLSDGCDCVSCKVGDKAKGIPTCQRCTGAICDICAATEDWIGVNETCRHDQADWALELALIWQRQQDSTSIVAATCVGEKLAASVIDDALRVARPSAVRIADQVMSSVFSMLQQEEERCQVL